MGCCCTTAQPFYLSFALQDRSIFFINFKKNSFINLLKSTIQVIFLLLPLATSAQLLTINQHKFEGNNKTKSSFLSLFIESQEGDTLHIETLQKDVQRLINQEVLGNVTLKIDTLSSTKADVIFICEEIQTLLPIVYFGGITDNFWFRIGASESNLGGKAQKLVAYYQYNDLSSFFVGYEANRVNGSKWGYSIAFNKWSTIEPLYFDQHTTLYQYHNLAADANLLFNLNYRTKIKLGGAFFQEAYNKENAMDFGPDNVKKDKILVRLVVDANKIDYHYFYQSGWRNIFNYETVNSLGEQVPFHIFFNDLIYFKRLQKRSNIATRLRMGLSTNNDSPFAPFVLDSYMNIRGSGNKVDRGTGSIVLNAEYRYTLIELNQVALQSNIFADLGTWRQPGGGFDDFSESKNIKTFFGVGLRGIYKKAYNAILRIDYGWNWQNTNERGFVLGIGQYF